MKKSIQIYIQADGVELKDIEVIRERLDEILEEYEYKRIQITIQDETLVRQPTR